MARYDFKADSKAFELLDDLLRKTEGNTEQAINEVLHGEAGRLINDEIITLLPVSRRTWRGKKTAAKSAQPFRQEDENLSVTIRTKESYHYLYFPDDGTNTLRHAGEQYFMIAGAEQKQNDIIDRCITKITEKFIF